MTEERFRVLRMILDVVFILVILGLLGWLAATSTVCSLPC